MRINFNNNSFKYVLLTALLIITFLFTGGMKKMSSLGKAYENLKIFTEVVSLIESSYVEEVKPKELIEGAIKGLLKNLDSHSSYMPLDSFTEMKVDTEGEFGGLGIEISIRKNLLTVVSPIEGTPAYRSGIESGDIIIKIDGESTRDVILTDAVKKLRGPVNSKVTISIFRKEFKTPKDFTITRAIIKIKSVWYTKMEGNIGYARVRNFAKTTTDEIKAGLDELSKEGPLSGVVLDLRNNPGGLLKQAVSVSNLFMKKNELVVYTEGRTPDQNMKFLTDKDSEYVDLPMVILVNGGSASASEIVAGALKDIKRAIVMGTKTFGKGSVQTIIPLSDGSGLRLTTAHYFTPSGKVIQDVGIIPDIIVENKVRKSTDEEDKEKEQKDKQEKEISNRIFGIKNENSDKGEETENKKQSEGGKSKEIQEAKFLKSYKNDNQLQRAVQLLKGVDLFQDIRYKKAS